jgi:hypothetical protein
MVGDGIRDVYGRLLRGKFCLSLSLRAEGHRKHPRSATVWKSFRQWAKNVDLVFLAEGLKALKIGRCGFS